METHTDSQTAQTQPTVEDYPLTPENEERVRRAVELFTQGYNCSQSVVAAFADLYGMSHETALRVSASFGGGIGRMRQTCGAAF